jgi:DtxR family Mn-dependent transcriptional regulator
MLSQAIQDYLKTIYKLQQEEDQVSTTKIAKTLNISGASVTGMLKRLASMKLVDYHSYKGVKLSDDGNKLALEILRHHRLLELYLKESLGFSLAKVHDEACRLEHYVSEEFVEKIDSILGYPEFSPLGNPIPSKKGELPQRDLVQLNEITPPENVIIAQLDDEDPEMLEYFENMQLLPKKEIKVKEKAPFNGPITIQIDDQEKILGNEIAKCIFVTLKK